MSYFACQLEPQAYAYVATTDGSASKSSVLVKWFEEVLPHYFEPASRQATIVSLPPPDRSLDPEVELDSPNFVPGTAVALAARGYKRQNGWR